MALPSGYKPVEYITCAGKQWFDTGIAPSANLAVEICVKPASAGLKENAIFGASWNVDGFFLMFYNNQVKFHSKGTDATTSGFDATVKSVIRCTQTSLVVNGTSYSLNGSGSDVTYNISMFTVTNSGVGSNNAAMYGDCYYCKMWQGDVLVRDFVPCLGDNGVPGMYDRVGDQFYPSTSGTAFIAGPVAVIERLEYIESTGTQYINTGFKPNQNTRIVFDFIPVSTDGSYLFGARTSSSSADKFAVLHPGGASNIRDDFGSEMSNVNLVPSGQTRIDKNKNVTTIGDVTVTHGSASFSSASLFLFANNTGGTAASMTSIRLLACQIYDNGTLVRDYIPYRYNGEVGLWDRVSNTFYGNSGTGVFAAGPVAEYAKVEYIESTGTQYVDTRFKPNQNTRVVCEVSGYPSTLSSQVLFGCRTSGSANDQYLVTATGISYRSDFYNGQLSFPSSVSYPDRVIVDKNKNETTIGESTVSHVNGDFSCAYNLTLFALNNGGSMAAYTSGVRMYFCQIYDNGILVRDFVPAVRADGTPGLLDQTNNAFYTNSGTGTFVVGPDLDYTKLEYIESTGTQYVDTGFIPN